MKCARLEKLTKIPAILTYGSCTWRRIWSFRPVSLPLSNENKCADVTYWYAFYRDRLLLEKRPDGGYEVPCDDAPPTALPADGVVLSVCTLPDGVDVKAYSLSEPCDGGLFCETIALRSTYYLLPREQYLLAGKCRELLHWDATTRFCGACGAPMPAPDGISKRCSECGREVWPQLSVAIIVLVRRGDEMLLVHANNFVSDFFGLVAGFVETGETLEEAVTREVREETGLTVEHIRYVASQPWPYPSGLMVGFFADYRSGEITLQRSELTAGGWFSRRNLPTLPEPLSIARRLIDAFLGEK